MLIFWLFDVCLLVAKLYFPTQTSRGAAEGDTSMEVWLLPQPFFMRLQGPVVELSWAMSALAIGLSYVAPAWTWRDDREADAAALRHTMIAGEVIAHILDWALRGRFLRGRAGADVEQAKPKSRVEVAAAAG